MEDITLTHEVLKAIAGKLDTLGLTRQPGRDPGRVRGAGLVG